MAQTITLHLVNDMGSDSFSGSQSDVESNWPGTPTPFDFNNTPQGMGPVWIGVSADGTSNQPYPLSTPVSEIIGAGWPRVYQGTEIVTQDGDVLLFSEQFEELQALLDACCATEVPTQTLALKQSIYPLGENDPNPPCGAEAIFTLLAIFGTNEERVLNLDTNFTIAKADGTDPLVFTFNNNDPFSANVRITKKWPQDFLGLLSDNGFTLVNNFTTPGGGQRQVKDYDGGTIFAHVELDDGDDNPVLQDNHTWRLPGTKCGPEVFISTDFSGGGNQVGRMTKGGILRYEKFTTSSGQIFNNTGGALTLYGHSDIDTDTIGISIDEDGVNIYFTTLSQTNQYTFTPNPTKDYVIVISSFLD